MTKNDQSDVNLDKQLIITKLSFTANRHPLIILGVRRDGRVVECTGLENRHGFVAHLGFKSLSLRHI